MKSQHELRQKILAFYHKYVIGVRDVDVVRGKVSSGESIFDRVTESDAAFAALVYVDNYGGWVDTINKKAEDPRYQAPKDNKTRWRKVRGKTKNVDRVGKEAKKFYANALEVFGALHGEDQDEELKKLLVTEGKEWWESNMRTKKTKRRMAPSKVNGDSGITQAPAVDKGAFAEFKRLFKKRRGEEGSGSSHQGGEESETQDINFEQI